MAGAFTKGNASALSERLGRAPSEGELYIAHFLGAGGAARLIELAASNPERQGRRLFSERRARQSLDFLRSDDRRRPKPRRRCATSSPPATTSRAAARTSRRR